jgi:hypothetical protein
MIGIFDIKRLKTSVLSLFAFKRALLAAGNPFMIAAPHQLSILHVAARPNRLG